MITGPLIFTFVLAIFVLIVIAKTAIVVPQQSAYVVENLGATRRRSRPASTS